MRSDYSTIISDKRRFHALALLDDRVYLYGGRYATHAAQSAD